LSEVKIPEDLTERYEEALRWKSQGTSVKATSTQWSIDVIERIGHLEQENAVLKNEIQRLRNALKEAVKQYRHVSSILSSISCGNYVSRLDIDQKVRELASRQKIINCFLSKTCEYPQPTNALPAPLASKLKEEHHA
jgi:vacuolar-type H+-ATPase subunit I/STV1